MKIVPEYNTSRKLSMVAVLSMVITACLLLAGCSEDCDFTGEKDMAEIADSAATLSIQLMPRMATRAGTAEEVQNVYIILSDTRKGAEDVSYKKSATPIDGIVRMKVRPSSYVVHVWANIPPEKFSAINSKSDLTTTMTGLTKDYKGHPMYGLSTVILPSGGSSTAHVSLKQMTAMVAFNISMEYPEMEIISARFCNIRKEIPLLENSAVSLPTFTENVDVTKTFYLWGNESIGKGKAADWASRTVSDAPAAASYLEITVKLFSSNIPTTKTYRVYLGGISADGSYVDYSDYNIYPGVAYTYDISLKRNSMAVWGHVPEPGYAESKSYNFSN